jgi:hypothetical protein
MPNKIIEFECQRRVGVDNEILMKNFVPVDLRIQVWDNNFVSLSFGIEKELGCFRLCWGSYINFVESIEEWFFDEDDTITGQSCIDENVLVECTAHPDYSISIAFSDDGGETYNTIFCADRSKFLGAVDAAALEVEKLLPDEIVCYDENLVEQRVLH